MLAPSGLGATSTIPPTNDLESAIVATLPANSTAYTAVVRGVNNSTGIALVEAYDLDSTVDSKLANISTRGFVQTVDNVMIGGFIVLGPDPQKVIVRAIGPSLANAVPPVAGALASRHFRPGWGQPELGCGGACYIIPGKSCAPPSPVPSYR